MDLEDWAELLASPYSYLSSGTLPAVLSVGGEPVAGLAADGGSYDWLPV